MDGMPGHGGGRTVFYLIDGYNLLHRVGLISSQITGSQLEWARRRLLERLSAHYAAEGYRVTVVFDARNARQRDSADPVFHGIQVRFAREEEADDLIETLIRESDRPSVLTVVSDDRRLREAARRRGCPVVGCVEYYESLGRPASQPARTGNTEALKPGPPSQVETEEWLKEFGETDDGWEY
jgi:predicted RNA-binding protein with PIN domain